MLKILLLMGALLSSSATADVKTVEEKWPDGSIKLRQQMAQDLLGRMLANGLETRYFQGGKKQTETTYRFGVMDGPWREYYLSGVLKREGSYKHGEKDGPETLYDYKGLKSSEINYKEGQREGKSFEWQGKNKVFEGQYVKDRLTGAVQEWYGNGTPKSVRHYNKAGALDGQEQSWYPIGQEYIEANYSDGQKNGEYQEWFSNGQMKYHAFYKQGIAGRQIRRMVCGRCGEKQRTICERADGRHVERLARADGPGTAAISQGTSGAGKDKG